MVERLGVAEDAGQRVVVTGGDRVKLVVVATSTTNGLGKEAPGDRFELLVDDVHPQLVLVLVLEVVVTQCQERGGDDVSLPLLQRCRRQQVSGNLFLDEAVKGAILVERFDHVIPVPPSLREQEASQRDRFGKANDIQPVSSPAFTEMRRGQQAVDQASVGLRRVVVDECLDLGRRRWQAQEVEVQTADQDDTVCLGGLSQRDGLEPFQQDGVDRRRSEPASGTGNGWSLQGLIGPVLPSRPQVDPRRGRGPVAAGVGCTTCDPLPEIGDDRPGQLALRRHLQRFVVQGPQQQALFWFARDDYDTAVAPFPEAQAVIQSQAATQLLHAGCLGGMAGVAVGNENRTDLLLEKGGIPC